MSSKVLLTAFISSVVLSGCVKKDYVVMNGATPAMPKEQALAWCEDKVDSGADLKIEQARLNGALSDAMQPKTYTMNGFTNCNSIGSYTNCNSTGYATPMPSYNSGQYGQAMGAALGAAFARPGEIKKCMAMLGYSEIEVKQNSPKSPASKVSNTVNIKPSSNGDSPLSVGSVQIVGNHDGWTIGRLEADVGFTGCFATNDYSRKQGLPLSFLLERGHLDRVLLSIKHDGIQPPTTESGVLRIGELQFNNPPMRSLTGNESLALLSLNNGLIDAIESRGLLSWDVNRNYAFVLPNAENLFLKLKACVDGTSGNLLRNSDNNLTTTSSIDLVGGNDGLTNEQRYNIARQILDYRNENKGVKQNQSIKKTVASTLSKDQLAGRWFSRSTCSSVYALGPVEFILISSTQERQDYKIMLTGNGMNYEDGFISILNGQVDNLNYARINYPRQEASFSQDGRLIEVIQQGSGCEVSFRR